MDTLNKKDWVVYIRAPIMPRGIDIVREVSIDEVRDVLDEIRDKLPEWKATATKINHVLWDIERLSEK